MHFAFVNNSHHRFSLSFSQISSKAVSIHHPLTRALAGFSLHLGTFGLHLSSAEFSVSERPSPVEMMEPSLRATVLVAQVQAGMWRRNGYSLVDQVRVYHDPRCRKEMYDQDVIMLQLAAASVDMDPDEYLVHVVTKFGLTHWADENFDTAEGDDSIRQVR